SPGVQGFPTLSRTGPTGRETVAKDPSRNACNERNDTMVLPEHRMTHLQQLEAESIHIIREVAAEFDNPVMMYSIGKDSSVMLHLARKAFAPGKPPFPLLHVDTTWKFREMISFRDKMTKEAGMEL